MAHALYECRFYKDGAADRARDMQMHVAVTGFLTQVGKELSLPLCEDMQAADQLEKHLKDIAKAHREGIHFQNEYREPMQKAYPVYYEAVKRNIYMLEHGIGYSCSEDDLTLSCSMWLRLQNGIIRVIRSREWSLCVIRGSVLPVF